MPPPAPELPAAVSAEAPPPPTAPEEVRIDGVRAARVASLARVGRGLFDAFSNESPRPVIRGFAQTTTVQFRTDKRGVAAWVESPTMAMHHVTAAAEREEPCKLSIEVGATVILPGLGFGQRARPGAKIRLERGPDHDTLHLDDKTAILPRGVSHGACVGPDNTRVWIGWSTPLAPSEVFSVAVNDGSVRPLRIDARPGLGALADAHATETALPGGPAAAVAEPLKGTARAAVILVVDEGPLAGWDPLTRLLVEAEIGVIRVGKADVQAAVALARARWQVPISVVARSVEAPGGTSTWLFEREPRTVTDVPEGVFLVGAGEAHREALSALAARGAHASWAITSGTPREAVALAWARVADAALEATN